MYRNDETCYYCTLNAWHVGQNDLPLGRALRLSHGVNKHLLYLSLAPSLRS